MDSFIDVFALVGIGLGIFSFIRPNKLLKYGFYVSVLAATGLRMLRSVSRRVPVGSMDILLAAFLLTAIFWEYVGAKRGMKR